MLPGVDGISRRRRAMTVGLVVAVAVLSGASPAWAREDPPDVTGLPVPEATAALAEWNKSVLFTYDPPPDVDLGVDRSLIVVSRAVLVNPSTLAAPRPVVALTLGRRAPDLTGLTATRATEALDRLALRLVAGPAEAGPDWVIGSQLPAAGTILEFARTQSVVTVTLAAPAVQPTPGPTPPPDPPRDAATVDLVLIGGSGLALVLLIALGAVALRRSLGRRGEPAALEHVEVRSFGGEVTGPDVYEPAPSPAVRLVGHPGPGAVELEEVPG